MKPHVAEAAFDVAKQGLKPCNWRRRSRFALEQYGCATHRHNIGDLSAEAVECRAGEVRLNGSFGVADLSVKSVAHYTVRMQPTPYSVGLHANTNQIIACKAVQSVVTADSHGS